MARRDRLGALAVLLLAMSVIALAGLACSDEGDFLLDDGGTEATETPPFFERSPEPSPEPSPVGSPPVAGATPVAPFEIEPEGTVNQRAEPTTDSDAAGTLAAGDTATVVAQLPGEEVTSGNDLWYQLADGTFVYSGVVQTVEEPPDEGAGEEEAQQ